MGITELAVLRWLHIIAMVYWLGGEWGVFNTSTHVINRDLSMEERRRHMQTAYHIDILARIGIISCCRLGLHMGYLWGVQALTVVISLWRYGCWRSVGLALCISAYFYRETDRGIQLTLWDERVRFVLIPVMVIASISSLLGYGPFNVGPMQYWFSIKILLYSVTLMIGLKLRFIMREWTTLFPCAGRGAESGSRESVREEPRARQTAGLLLLDHDRLSGVLSAQRRPFNPD
jgi:hypothetical protein